MESYTYDGFVIEQGTTVSELWEYQDDNGIVSLVGYACQFQIVDGEDVLLEKTDFVCDATGLTVVITDTETLALPVGVFPFQALLTAPDDTVPLSITGRCTIKQIIIED